MNRDICRMYDIFGVDFQSTDFYEIARAFAERFQPETGPLGHDA